MPSLGRHEWREQLGEGGFATVYRAWDPALGCEVALKLLLARHTTVGHLRSGFLEEARTLAQLHHPNIVTMHDIGEADTGPFVAIKLVQGETIAALVQRRGPLPLPEVQSLLGQLCDAVQYLHTQGLVHRDLKAANVMVTPAVRVVLIDFGIARLLEGTTQTATGMLIGTPSYMAPEQVTGKTATPATDVYALGVLAYEMLARTVPFVGETMHVLYAHVHEAPPALCARRPSLPTSVCQAVAAALAKDPADRPQSAVQFATMLGCMSSQPRSKTLLVRPARPPRRGRLRMLTIGGVAALTLVGGATLAAIVRPSPEAESPSQRSAPTTGTATDTAMLPATPQSVTPTTITAPPPAPSATPPTVTPPVTPPAAATPVPSPSPPAMAQPGPRTTTTPAGALNSGFADGAGAAARFNYPQGVAVDAAGTVYVPDLRNHRIRKITPAGVVSTLAGGGSPEFRDGAGSAAQFNGPAGVAVDAAGNVYVSDFSNHSIRVVSPAGDVRTLAGGGTAGFADCQGRAARFNSPGGLAVDGDGTVYVADIFNHRVRRISPSGMVTTLAGSGTAGFADGPSGQAQFNDPAGLVVDPQGVVHVTDFNNNCIRRITPNGTVMTVAGAAAADLVDGGVQAARFNGPTRLARDAAGVLYVADLQNHAIRAITPDGTVITIAGGGRRGSQDGIGPEASFYQPEGVAVGPDGVLYVADAGNHRIRRLAP